MCLMFSVLYLSPGSISIASGQGQVTEVKVLERGNNWQCPLKEERERARNQINMIISQVIASVAMAHQDGGVLLLST